MIRAEPEEIKKLKELSKKYKGCRCSQFCPVWNSEDRDCEIMGSYYLSPSRCRWFLMQELRRDVENVRRFAQDDRTGGRLNADISTEERMVRKNQVWRKDD